MYTATVYDALNDPVDKITVTATPEERARRGSLTPADADSVMDDHQVNLMVGENTIRVMVTVTGATQTYMVKVTRIAASDATLTALSLVGPATATATAIELSPSFAAATTMYTASVDNDVTSATVMATEMHSAATATVIGGAILPAGGDPELSARTPSLVVVRAVDGMRRSRPTR